MVNVALLLVVATAGPGGGAAGGTPDTGDMSAPDRGVGSDD
ncbi:hypothetical protein [Streptomyces abikoensis]|nr:hypothetical protein [Streptomyces abikoensis]